MADPGPARATTGAAGRRLAVGAFFGGLVVFLIGIGRPAYWIDEATTVATALRSWPELFHLIIVNDPTLGLYYLVMKPWTSLSTAEWWVRLPSAVAMAVAVALVSWYASRLSRIRVGVFTAIFAVLSVSMISRYAQEARPYAFTVLCAVLMVIAWHSALRHRSRQLAVGYAAAIVATGLFHLYSVTLVVALTAAAWQLDRADRRRNLIWTLVPSAAALVVLVPFLALSAANAPGPAPDGEFDQGLRSQVLMISGLFTPVGSPPTLTRYSLALALVVLALAVVGATSGIRRYRSLTIVCGSWAVIPPVLLYFVQLLGLAPTERPRYWLFVVPAWCVLVALGLDRLARRSSLLSAAALVIAVGLAVPAQVVIRGINGHNRTTSLRDLDAALRVPALAGLPVVAGSPGDFNAIRGYGPDIVGSRFPLSRSPDDEGRFFLTEIPSQAEITSGLAGYPAVILLVKGTRDYGDWPDALRTAGFGEPIVRCWFGPRKTRQFVVLKRPDANLSGAAEITRQVVASAPDSMSRCNSRADVIVRR